MLLSANSPNIFISPQLAERAHDENIVGMTVSRHDLMDTVAVAAGHVKPSVGALVLRDRSERNQNPDLLQLPQTGEFGDAEVVDLDEVRLASRSQQTHPLLLRPRELSLEGLRRATHTAVTKWHDAPGAWDNMLWLGYFGGGGLGLGADILFRGFEFGDFPSLREKALATAAGALAGVATITPAARNLKYRSDVKRLSGYPIDLQFA